MKIVIFGSGDIAQLARFYFEHDSPHQIGAFTVDRQYLTSADSNGVPVVAFDEVAQHYPPEEFGMFVALSYSGLNSLRRKKCEEAKSKGYQLVSYLSTRATVWPGFNPGENNFILEGNNIQPFAEVGDNVTLWSGNHIGHHSRIEDHCFIASHVVVSGGVIVGESSFVGVNATIRDHVKIGPRCVIGAGALISTDAEADGVYAASQTERSRVPSYRLKKI